MTYSKNREQVIYLKVAFIRGSWCRMDAQEPNSEPSHEMKVESGMGEPHRAWPIGARTAHVNGGMGRDPAQYPGHPLLSTTIYRHLLLGFPGSSDSKESACNPGDPGLISELGRSPGEGHGYPLQYSCLENSMDIGAWQATIHGVPKSWTQLSD